jgi:uncharacterized membrane-anchored protein YjiN (DUF445 family)
MKRRHTPASPRPGASPEGKSPDILNRRRKKFIMQVRQVIAAALLAVTAVGAMSQEIDRAETLQGKSLAAAQADNAGRSRASVVAELRNLQADGQLKAVGERAEDSAVPVVTQTEVAGRTRADVKAELAQWRQTHKLVVGERG